ncbi:MAG: hypothetical protein AAGC85_18675 [Bacteroidota bacterium]
MNRVTLRNAQLDKLLYAIRLDAGRYQDRYLTAPAIHPYQLPYSNIRWDLKTHENGTKEIIPWMYADKWAELENEVNRLFVQTIIHAGEKQEPIKELTELEAYLDYHYKRMENLRPDFLDSYLKFTALYCEKYAYEFGAPDHPNIKRSLEWIKAKQKKLPSTSPGLLTHKQQMLLIYYLGLNQASAETSAMASVLGPLIGRSVEQTRKYLTYLTPDYLKGSRKTLSFTRENLEVVKGLLEGVKGYEKILAQVEEDLKKFTD